LLSLLVDVKIIILRGDAAAELNTNKFIIYFFIIKSLIMEKTDKNKKEIAKTTNPEVDVELTEKDLDAVSGGTFDLRKKWINREDQEADI